MDEVGWDEDSDSGPSTPQPTSTFGITSIPLNSGSSIPPVKEHLPSEIDQNNVLSESGTLKPNEPRRSQDQHSQPDSDASYDLVSGATSRAPGSPRDEKDNEKRKAVLGGTVAEESDEEDWE